jgi:hypothetical protein
MATVTRTALIDDLDGSDADVSVTLLVDNKRVRVDLSRDNYREWIAPLVKAGQSRRARPATRRASTAAKSSGATKVSAKRQTKATAYARLSVKDQGSLRSYLKRPRGRVADDAVQAWRAAGKPLS